VLDVSEWGQLLLYSTQRGGVHALDHRAGRDAWVLPAKARQVLHTHLQRQRRSARFTHRPQPVCLSARTSVACPSA